MFSDSKFINIGIAEQALQQNALKIDNGSEFYKSSSLLKFCVCQKQKYVKVDGKFLIWYWLSLLAYIWLDALDYTLIRHITGKLRKYIQYLKVSG